MVKTLDTFVNSLGDPGRFQVIAFLFLWSNTFPLAYNNFVMVYYGLPPGHHCKLSNETIQSFPLNESVPKTLKKGKLVMDSCKRFVDPANHSLGSMDCDDGWTFTDEKNRSIMGEWDLICSKKWKVSLATSIYFVGVMFGGLIGGLVSDKFGRRPVILGTIYLQCLLGIGVAFTPNYELFVALRFFQAMLIQSLQTCSFTLTMELFKPHMRTIVGTICSLAWTIAVVTLAIVASQIYNWRYLQLVVTLPSILSFFYFWFIPESLRWLISKRKLDRAEVMATKILKFNKIVIPDARAQIDKSSEECQAGKDDTQKSSMLDLVRTPKIRKFTCILCFLWFTASLITYGVSYALSSLGGNIYISFCISGALDFVTRLLVIPALQKFGRRRPTVVCYFSSGICCLAVPVIAYAGQDTEAGKIISMIAAVVGKAFMSACFAIIPIYTTELYPTVIRALGQGLSIFASRIGGILAPQLTFLGSLFWTPFPFVACGISGVIAAILAYFLPETQGRPLPDMIDDVEHPEMRKYSIKESIPMEPNGNLSDSKPEKIPELEGLTSLPDGEQPIQNNNQVPNGFSNSIVQPEDLSAKEKADTEDEDVDETERKAEEQRLTQENEIDNKSLSPNPKSDTNETTSSIEGYFTPGRTPDEMTEAESEAASRKYSP